MGYHICPATYPEIITGRAAPLSLFGLAPCRVYLISLQHYLYILSVALVLTLRWTGVTRYIALWSPDFPHENFFFKKCKEKISRDYLSMLTYGSILNISMVYVKYLFVFKDVMRDSALIGNYSEVHFTTVILGSCCEFGVFTLAPVNIHSSRASYRTTGVLIYHYS